MNNPKRQHIVARVYLEGFTNPTWLLNFYDRDKKTFKEQNPLTISRINHFYTLVDDKWNKDFSVESFFWNVIESRLPEVFQKIENYKVLNLEEKDILASFISFQLLKTESFQKSVDKASLGMMKRHHDVYCNDEQLFISFKESYKADKWSELEISFEDFKDIYKNFDIQPTNRMFIRLMFETYDEVFPIIRHLDWEFMVSKKDTTFLTSDNPFSKMQKNTKATWGLIDNNTLRIFPISKDICLKFTTPEKPLKDNFMFYKEVPTKKLVWFYNGVIAVNSHRLIIGKDKALIESIIKKNDINSKGKHETLRVYHSPKKT